MGTTTVLLWHPDLVLRLEGLGLIPQGIQGGEHEGAAKLLAKEGKAPYDTLEMKALAERLAPGWEEITEEEKQRLLSALEKKMADKQLIDWHVPRTGGQAAVSTFAEALLASFAALSAHIAGHGLGTFPAKEEQEVQAAKEFSWELLLRFLQGTGFLKTLFYHMAELLKTSREDRRMMAEMLTLAAYFLMITTAAKGNREKRDLLLLSFKEEIVNALNAVDTYVSNQMTAGALQGEQVENAALFLRQGKLAMEKEDGEGLAHVVEAALQALGTSTEALEKDANAIAAFASNLHELLARSLSEEENLQTAVSQAM